MYTLSIPPVGLIIGLTGIAILLVVYFLTRGKPQPALFIPDKSDPEVPPKQKDTTPIEQVLIILYGIHQGKLFIQLASKGNDVAYFAETEIAGKTPGTIMEGLYKLFPDSFKKTGIKMPSISYFRFDGQKIARSGEEEIIECEIVEDVAPNFIKMIVSFIYDNGTN